MSEIMEKIEEIVDKLTFGTVVKVTHNEVASWRVIGKSDYEELKSLIQQLKEKKMDKANVFVKHIEDHIKEMGIESHGGKVVCKICGKDIDTIFKEEVKK